MMERIENNPYFSSLSTDIEESNESNPNNSSFVKILGEQLNEVNQLQEEADQLTEDFALGKTDNVHQVTVSTEKARLALELTLAIQNKVVDAYDEIMRMQI